jgi:NTE family protein
VAVRINLALQGGGAHGAFTWGVLDRLLQDEDIEIAGISGTSAGALNGAALKAGMIEGGRDGARENLDWLWNELTGIGDLRFAHWMSALFPAPGLISRSIEYSLPFSFADAATRVFSPYSYGVFYRNPLAGIAERFHYDTICAADDPAFFVCATNVRTGKIRVFSGKEITPDTILASTCLPTIFEAVEIDGEYYWDGGYSGNPALFPLFDPALPDDIVIVNINPLVRPEIPKDAPAILNRINEISFNSSLLRELRAIGFVKRLIRDGKVAKGAMKDVIVHMIADDALMTKLSLASKLVPSPSIILALRDAGHAAADAFLASHRDRLGNNSSVELSGLYD